MPDLAPSPDVERLREALEGIGEFANHNGWCLIYNTPPRPCTCGFAEAEAALRAALEGAKP